MKKYIISGLVILFPAVVTILIISFIVNLFTNPFQGVINNIIESLDGYLSNIPQPVLLTVSKLVIFFLIICFTILVGYIGRWFFVHYLFRWFDEILHRIPLIKSVYKAAKDVVHSLFSPSSPSFSKVVFVPFPSQHSLSIGLISKDEVPIIEKSSKTDKVSIFVPGTPNPTVGFLLMFKKEELIFTDMKVDDAMKFVISCGVMAPQFNIQTESK